MDEDLIVVAVYGVMLLVGGPLAVARIRRDKQRQGRLSVHDGETLRMPQPTPSSRVHLLLAREGTPEGVRVTVSGCTLATQLGFRLEGKTQRTSSGLSGRLVVEGTRGSKKAARLFARSDVNAAVALACGASCSFKRIDLFPDGDLAVVVARGVGDLDDLCERLLRFAEVLEHAAPSLADDGVDLGATSGTTSSAAFSIEIRS